MSTTGARPIFVDTGAFYARFDEDDAEHDRARRVFDAIRDGDLPYRPIYTQAHVLAELVTLTLSRGGSDEAAAVLEIIRQSPNVTTIHPDAVAFDAACEQFFQYDDQDISLVDHLTGVLADERDVEYVFTLDPDDFHTLGFRIIPDDIRIPDDESG